MYGGTLESLYFNGFVCLEGFLDRELGRVNVLSRGSVRVSHAHTNAVTRVVNRSKDETKSCAFYFSFR